MASGLSACRAMQAPVTGAMRTNVPTIDAVDLRDV